MNIESDYMNVKSPIERIGPYIWEECLNHIRSFHGHVAPGVLVGCVMVDLAMKQIPDSVLFNAICETSSCLPDAVQLLTPCTVGNSWLRIINLGRYAVILYDKYKGYGVRIYLDPKKLQDWGEIQAWLMKLKTKNEQNADRLLEQIRMAGQDIYTMYPVKVKSSYLTKHSKGNIGLCPICGEAYPIKDGPTCLGCQGKPIYDVLYPPKS